jgi:hypothetical protein
MAAWIKSRCVIQYNVVNDSYALRLDTKEKCNHPFGKRLKTGYNFSTWSQHPEMNKTVHFLGNYHRYEGIEEDLLFEQAEILPKLMRYLNNQDNKEPRQYCKRRDDGLLEIPIETIMQ